MRAGEDGLPAPRVGMGELDKKFGNEE